MTALLTRPKTAPPPAAASAPAGPPPKLPEGHDRDEPWKITLYVSTPNGGWKDSFWMDLIQDWQREDRLQSLIECYRRRLVDGQGIVATKVPWEREKRVYDPPLGPLPPPASSAWEG